MRIGGIRASRGADTEVSPPPQPVLLELMPEKQVDGKGNCQYPLRWNRVKGAATARDSECSGRGDGGEVEQV